MEKYIDRHHAGKVLAAHLQEYTNINDIIVLALPRGGVPVAYEIAKALSVVMDLFIVRKLGVPGHEELAMGAIATGGVTIFNQDILRDIHIEKAAINQVIKSEEEELARRDIAYRGGRPFPNLIHKTIILVDDGIATGATMRAAIKALRQQEPKNIIVAVPVAALPTCEEIGMLVDKIICPIKAEHFYAVGAWYDDFQQTSDEEVHELLLKINKQQ